MDAAQDSPVSVAVRRAANMFVHFYIDQTLLIIIPCSSPIYPGLTLQDGLCVRSVAMRTILIGKIAFHYKPVCTFGLSTIVPQTNASCTGKVLAKAAPHGIREFLERSDVLRIQLCKMVCVFAVLQCERF